MTGRGAANEKLPNATLCTALHCRGASVLARLPSARLKRRSFRHLPALWHLDGPLPRPPHFTPSPSLPASEPNRKQWGWADLHAQAGWVLQRETHHTISKGSMSLKLALCRDLQQRALTVSTLAAGADVIFYHLSFSFSFLFVLFSFLSSFLFCCLHCCGILHDRFSSNSGSGSGSGLGCPETSYWCVWSPETAKRPNMQE